MLRESAVCPPITKLNNDCLSQLVVDIVSAVLNGNGTTSASAGNNCNGFAAVAAQGEQERIEIFVVGLDATIVGV